MTYSNDLILSVVHLLNFCRPGLLGKTKYEFAKTYCAVKFVCTSQGKTFKVLVGLGVLFEEHSIFLNLKVKNLNVVLSKNY